MSEKLLDMRLASEVQAIAGVEAVLKHRPQALHLLELCRARGSP